MAETHDTIDGLLAEFRGYAAGMPTSYHVTMSWHDFRRMLDRIEAAHKREAAVGDCAKLRKALEMVRDAHYTREVNGELYEGFEVEADDGTGRPLICIVKNALAAPPRNCDRHECATTKAAQDVWRKEDGGKTAYYEWLLATYKEGGNDGK